MKLLKINLTEDLIKLISNIRFKDVDDTIDSEKYPLTMEIDCFCLYGGSYLLEDIATILGRRDEHIDGTEEDAMGMRFPRETEDYFFTLHDYIMRNLYHIEQIVHQFSCKGGLTVGTYTSLPNQEIWEKLD